MCINTCTQENDEPAAKAQKTSGESLVEDESVAKEVVHEIHVFATCCLVLACNVMWYDVMWCDVMYCDVM